MWGLIISSRFGLKIKKSTKFQISQLKNGIKRIMRFEFDFLFKYISLFRFNV